MSSRERAEPAYRLAFAVADAVLRLAVRRPPAQPERLPAGGVIVCPNHIGNADPPIVADFLIRSGRWPRFLAKASLFDAPWVGRLVRATGQLQVARRSGGAAASLDAAADALAAGACVVVYPEGTVTHDPGEWPMTGHPGAARLALRTGAPVVPLGQWGANAIFDRWHLGRPRLFPRAHVVMRLGDPVVLDDLRPGPGEAPGAREVSEATDRIMAAITALVEDIRGEPAPASRFDMRRDWTPGFGADGRPREAGDPVTRGGTRVAPGGTSGVKTP